MRPAKRKPEVIPASKVSKVKKADDEPLLKASKAKNEKLPIKAKKVGSDTSEHTKDTALIISQLEIVVKENEALRELNKRKDDKIFELEKTIVIIKAKENTSKTVSAQTEDLDRMWCIECEYPAEDLYDLGEHMYEIHAEENSDYTISCYYCGNNFKSKEDLMVHRKKAHVEKVGLCKFFAEGHCERAGDCWFRHDKTAEKEFKCILCDKIFKTRYDFMHHRKNEHPEIVPECKENYGKCKLGVTKCWFIHNDGGIDEGNNIVENSHDKNHKMIEKLFDMVEKFTERIIQLENQKQQMET